MMATIYVNLYFKILVLFCFNVNRLKFVENKLVFMALVFLYLSLLFKTF